MASSVVLITGALTGIGRATAFAFARIGAQLVVSGRHDETGRSLAGELREAGAEAEFVRADVRMEDEVRVLVDRAVARFGRLDIAVNNAGTEGRPGTLTEQGADDYRAIFDTNVLGTMLSLKHELRVMRPQGNGAIVNLSSIVGHKALPGAPLYVASKHAVEGLTKAAAFGVRVTAVAPGPIATGMLDRFAGSDDAKAGLVGSLPLKRAGTPEEVARVIMFAASEAASYMTGCILAVDGGMTAD
jgi:NAD(P)-dependent dehydrogenase (short-subunit alcohol dehydrogenase family)